MSAEVITVVGVGGIGGVLAGGLALAGERVQVVEIGPHLEALRERGLRLEGLRGTHQLALERACAPDEIEGQVGLVLLATRAHQTAAALEALAPHLTGDSLVVSTQNGLNPYVIAARIGAQRTIPCMVHLVGAQLEPGVVCRYTEGELFVGEYDGTVSERARSLAQRLSPAVQTHAVENVWGFIWCKLIHVAQNAGTALVDAPAGAVREPVWVRRILVALELEVVDAATATGIRLEPYERIDPDLLRNLRTPADLQRALNMLPHASEKGYNGLQRELSRGVKTEIDAVSGEIVRTGREHGVPMTLTARLVELIHDVEEHRRERTVETLRLLEEPAEQLLAARTIAEGTGAGV